MIKRICCVLALVMLCAGAFGCGGSEKRTVRIARSSVYTAATCQVMQSKKILEKHLPKDVSVEWKEVLTGPDLRDSVVANKADIAEFALMTFISAYENGLPVRLLSAEGGTPINVYSCDEKHKSLKDFSSNEKIAITNRATNLHVAFLGQATKELGNNQDIEKLLSPIPASDAVAAIKTGDNYAGAVFSFPMMVKAEAIDKVKLVADMTDVIKEYNVGSAIVFNSGYYEKNPDIVAAFKKAQEETVEFIKRNPQEAAEILSKIYKVEPERIVEVIKKMPPEMKVVGYDKQAELLYKSGILKKEPKRFSELPNYKDIVK